jgi:hypothetical protein
MTNINDLLEGKELLHERIDRRMKVELKRQKDAGKEFISDSAINDMIDLAIKEEMGDSYKEDYTNTKKYKTRLERKMENAEKVCREMRFQIVKYGSINDWNTMYKYFEIWMNNSNKDKYERP